LDEFGEDVFDVLLIAHVARESSRIPATSNDFTCHGLRCFSIDIENAHARSTLCKPLHDGAPNTATTAGDDGNLAVQAKRTGRVNLGVQRENPRFKDVRR
jgi:hypothetical protein